MAASSLRIPSTDSSAQGSEPRPPALDTATASVPACTPAIGAWRMGNAMPSNWVSAFMRTSGVDRLPTHRAPVSSHYLAPREIPFTHGALLARDGAPRELRGGAAPGVVAGQRARGGRGP